MKKRKPDPWVIAVLGVCILLAFAFSDNAVHVRNSSKDADKVVISQKGKMKCNWTSVEISNGVKRIEDGEFADCSRLTSVKIPNSVKRIGNEAFSGCSSLTSVEIPDSVTSIGRGAFGDCSGLTSVTIHNGAVHIADDAFYGCDSLTALHIAGRDVDVNELKSDEDDSE